MKIRLQYDSRTDKIITITPEIAKHFLEHNYEDNRNVRQYKVHQYANDMARGRWNPQISTIQDPIVFNDNGIMENGQHRCLACIASGASFTSKVVFGIHDPDGEIYNKLDNGSARKTADFVKSPNANSVASIAKIYIALSEGNAPLLSAIQGKMTTSKKGAYVPSRDTILESFKEHSSYYQKIHSMGTKLASPFGRNRGDFKTAVLIIDFVGRGDVLEDFVDDFGSSNSQNPSVIACKSYMTRCYCSNNFSTSGRWVIGCILAAYEYFRTGKASSCYNKPLTYIDKYDKYLEEVRNNKESDNA